MIEFITKQNQRNLILFVHGFTGGKDTWKNKEYGYFFDILNTQPVVRNNFDIATFEYFTTLSNLLATAKSSVGKLRSLFKSLTPKTKKNIGVDEIADLLRSEIRFQLRNYDHIVVIAHSMGGLVTKASIVKDAKDDVQCRIKLFISLAVPHLGAELATYGKLFSDNVQINDLAPLSDICPKLNDQWVKLSLKPTIKYFYGSYDGIVKEVSAVGTDNLKQDAIACADDHVSICKPEGPNSTVIIAIATFLEEFITGDSGEAALEIKKLSDEGQFDDEYFVLKLLVADVHNATVTHSKELFLNAEYARKLFSSSADQKKLQELYEKIRSLYKDSFDKFIADGMKNSGQLVSEIHDKIVREDSAYLRTALPLIHALHKKGMLHQLANDLRQDIWWNDSRSVEVLEAIKAKFEAID